MVNPRCSVAAHTSANCCELLFSGVLGSRTANRLHRSEIRHERKSETRHAGRHCMKEFKHRGKPFVRMVWHETTREQFRSAFRDTEWPQLVRLAMLEHEDGIHGRLRCLGNSGIAVPRCTVHLNPAIFLTENDAVVAEHAGRWMVRPQTRRRALACSGMSRKQHA